MDRRVNYCGFIIAGIGFFLTRFTITLTLYDDPIRFYLAGVVPLSLGLGLAAFGVAMAVADVDTSMVRTTAVWCVVGTATMFLLTILTLFGSTAGGLPDLETARSQAYLSNFLIGGSVGGTLTGVYASRNRQQRFKLQQQANQLIVLNRLLRDEILNAVTAIQGYTTGNDVDTSETRRVIEQHSDAIADTVEEVKYITRTTDPATQSSSSIDLEDCLEASVETVTDRYPAVDVSFEAVPEDVAVRANGHLEEVFVQLLENAVVHGKDVSPQVSVLTGGRTVSVTITDEGTGLPERYQAALETGEFDELNGPSMGVGLHVVRLFVDRFEGSIEAEMTDSGTGITVTLPRATDGSESLRPNQTDLGSIRPALPHLTVALVAALLAGVPYGLVSELLGGSVAGIGVFYGAADPIIGWLTHEFHSVVFGFVFVGLVSLAPDRYHVRVLPYVAIGLGWALVLWLGAASFVAPIWLRLLGIPASVPNVSFRLLLCHLAWGSSLGVLTAWGYIYAAPRLDRFTANLGNGLSRITGR